MPEDIITEITEDNIPGDYHEALDILGNVPFLSSHREGPVPQGWRHDNRQAPALGQPVVSGRGFQGDRIHPRCTMHCGVLPALPAFDEGFRAFCLRACECWIPDLKCMPGSCWHLSFPAGENGL